MFVALANSLALQAFRPANLAQSQKWPRLGAKHRQTLNNRGGDVFPKPKVEQARLFFVMFHGGLTSAAVS